MLSSHPTIAVRLCVCAVLLAACGGRSFDVDGGGPDAGAPDDAGAGGPDSGAGHAADVEALCRADLEGVDYCTTECFEAHLATNETCAAEIQAVEEDHADELTALRADCLSGCAVVRMCEGTNRRGPVPDCACTRACVEGASAALQAALVAVLRCQRDATAAACE